ncbi:hypothetical protein CMUS01_15521, partial [Colletotrichum musicola]
SRWFEVGRGHISAGNSGSVEAGTDDTVWFVALHDEQEQRFEAGRREEDAFTDKVEMDISSTQGGREEEVERMCLDTVMAFIEELYSQDRAGYSFLQNDHNEEWAGKGQGWIARQIAGSEARQRAWIARAQGAGSANDDGDDGHHPYHKTTVQAYEQTFESFQEQL